MHRQETVERYRTGRSHPERVVLEGFHPLKHALRFGADVQEALSPTPSEVLRLADALAPDVRDRIASLLVEIGPELFDELVPRPPATGVVATARRPAVSAAEVLDGAGPGPVVALEAPSHLGNLGAAVRVAAAAGAGGVVTTGGHDPWHASALRGSAGLHFAVPVARGPDGGGADAPAVGALPLGTRALVAVDPRGEPFHRHDLPGRAVLAFGTERHGLRRETTGRSALTVRLPMRRGVSSLNLATSVAALLYGWRIPRP